MRLQLLFIFWHIIISSRQDLWWKVSLICIVLVHKSYLIFLLMITPPPPPSDAMSWGPLRVDNLSTRSRGSHLTKRKGKQIICALIDANSYVGRAICITFSITIIIAVTKFDHVQVCVYRKYGLLVLCMYVFYLFVHLNIHVSENSVQYVNHFHSDRCSVRWFY